MDKFFTEIFELPELKLFLDYWCTWILVVIVLIVINRALIKRKWFLIRKDDESVSKYFINDLNLDNNQHHYDYFVVYELR